MGLFSKKTRESKLRSAVPAEPAGPPPVDGPGIERELRQCLARLSDGRLGLEGIDPRAHLFDVGYLDSFRSAELLAFVERRFGVQLAEAALVGKLCTVEALSRHIESVRSGAGS